MKLTDLQHLTEPGGPYATVALDATRADEAGRHETELRWRALRDELAHDGADEATLGALDEVVSRPTGRSGDAGIVAVARDGAVVHEALLPSRPVRDEAVWEPLPHLIPLIRGLDEQVRLVLVEVDHTGADVSTVTTTPGGAVAAMVETADATAGHDEVRKVSVGGWSQRRYQQRAEDSWEQNAKAVADDLDDLVARLDVDLVLVAGDPRSRPLVMDHLSGRVAAIASSIDAGSRHDDKTPRDGTLHPAVVEAVRGFVHDRRRAALEDLAEEIGRQGAGAQSLADVVAALRRGQVQEVFLFDDPTSTARLWVGDDPLSLGTRAELDALGVADPREVRADAALVAAAAAGDAGVTLIPGHPDDAGDLLQVIQPVEGVAARLRYADPSTPQSSLTAMTRDLEAGGTDTTGL